MRPICAKSKLSALNDARAQRGVQYMVYGQKATRQNGFVQYTGSNSYITDIVVKIQNVKRQIRRNQNTCTT